MAENPAARNVAIQVNELQTPTNIHTYRPGVSGCLHPTSVPNQQFPGMSLAILAYFPTGR